MKLLKYVMTCDSGLAPNPYFGICSLALCTPNHMNARLEPGDWVIGHSSADTCQRLVYAMRLTKVLDMQSYFTNFPQKHPVPNGSYEQQCGDNMYYRDGDRWARLPSAEHNSVDSFVQDQGRRVYLAEGNENYWYFGAGNTLRELECFADRFPWLIKDRQGFSYVYDRERIAAFSTWLKAFRQRGMIGQPRDRAIISANQFLVRIDPSPYWVPREHVSDEERPGPAGGKTCCAPRSKSGVGCSGTGQEEPTLRRSGCTGT